MHKTARRRHDGNKKLCFWILINPCQYREYKNISLGNTAMSKHNSTHGVRYYVIVKKRKTQNLVTYILPKDTVDVQYWDLY